MPDTPAERGRTGRVSNIVRMTSMILPVVILSKLLGMVRAMLLAGRLGAGREMDAYTASYTLILTLMVLAGCFLTTAFLPIYSRTRARGGQPAADRYASATLTFFLLGSLAVGLLLYAFMPFIVSVYATGFDAEGRALAVRLSRIMLPMLVAQCASYLFGSVLNAHEDFALPHLAATALSLTLIPTLLAASSDDPVRLAVLVSAATTASAVLEALIQLPVAARRVRFRPVLRPRDPLLGETLLVALPAVIAVAATELNQLLQNHLSSFLDAGANAVLSYGYNTYTIFIGVCVMPVTVILFSRLSAQAAAEDRPLMLETLRRYLGTMLLVLLPLVAVSMLLSDDIIGLLYERGEFTGSDTALTGAALMFFMPGLLGYAVKDVFSRFFFTLQDTRTPMMVGIAGLAVNVGLNYLLIGPMGVAGLALASSITLLLSGLALLLLLWRKTGSLELRRIAGETGRILLCAVGAALLCAAAARLLAGRGVLVRLLLAGGIPLVAYVAGVLALRVPSARLLADEILGMLRRKRA
ncbi:MAG: murein biosynthesis integral membrane protein MurJ [Clostridia bacterium]|nr:murein biosynthesis integral membrane protein MurJ [Clostridia bacterium]